MKSRSSRELIRLIEGRGWRLVAVRGSHHHFKHPSKPGKITIPHPRKDIPQGTVRSIFRRAGID
jgi:predicted RNA binding protein YcfA (HicA-like mRNA interferase family)